MVYGSRCQVDRAPSLLGEIGFGLHEAHFGLHDVDFMLHEVDFMLHEVDFKLDEVHFVELGPHYLPGRSWFPAGLRDFATGASRKAAG